MLSVKKYKQSEIYFIRNRKPSYKKSSWKRTTQPIQVFNLWYSLPKIWQKNLLLPIILESILTERDNNVKDKRLLNRQQTSLNLVSSTLRERERMDIADDSKIKEEATSNLWHDLEIICLSISVMLKALWILCVTKFALETQA
jgi:hypothetical protein